jgi:hypothetical protein
MLKALINSKLVAKIAALVAKIATLMNQHC